LIKSDLNQIRAEFILLLAGFGKTPFGQKVVLPKPVRSS